MRENIETALPVRLSQFVANDNDGMLATPIRDATIPQLLFAVRCQLDRMPTHQRGLMAMLAASTLAISAGEGAGHA